MAASRGDLVSIGPRIERSRELDTFQRFFPHNHGLQLHFAHNDSTGIYEDLDTSGMLGFGWKKFRPCAIAQSGLMTCNIDIVFDADSGTVERA